MRFVLDNSVSMRWLFADGRAADLAYAEGILCRFEQPGNEAIVPAIWPLEVANVIVRAETRGLLTEARGAEFIGILHAMAIRVDQTTTARALTDTLQLARRFSLSAYDAAYLELALREGLGLATLDGDLRTAATKAGTEIVEIRLAGGEPT
ncbi:type II toxin-antitoxin system VapC family toxin [uncultured Thiocystis sp.]|jgi:predicted nucleic acid-binding protein|uniref:type II toxin-antitoxin system VapC family toxin n=1 Tax=uncultured Thiocystis sp. TaxID=1202134 RepID=UPI0025FA0574|nr:type II toxin-antitoxin system VapC family toxin [uncultured Thiocystis sp.]